MNTFSCDENVIKEIFLLFAFGNTPKKNICLNQINFSPKQRNWCINIWIKDTLLGAKNFHSIQMNHFSKSKKVFQTNNFHWFNHIFFLCANITKWWKNISLKNLKKLKSFCGKIVLSIHEWKWNLLKPNNYYCFFKSF